MAEDTGQEQRSRIDWSATLAGAGAAVTVAVLLSTLGAAGTLIGAALGSMVATVSTALYKQGIETSRRRVAAVQAAALHKINQADQDVRRAGLGADPIARADLARARRRLDAAGSALEEGAADAEPEPTGTSTPVAPVPAEEESRWKALPWRRIAALTVAVFVVTLGVISAVELIAGRSVSSITGGTDGTDRTSLSGVLDGSGDDDREQRDEPTDPSTEPGESESTDPTQEPSESDTAPTEGASSEEPSPTVTVTETATVPETTVGTPSEVPTP